MASTSNACDLNDSDIDPLLVDEDNLSSDDSEFVDEDISEVSESDDNEESEIEAEGEINTTDDSGWKKINPPEVPSDRPSITGARSRYRIGDVLHSNCSSSWSRPAAKLNWMVNDRQASPHQLVHYSPRKDTRSDRESSLLGLQLVVKPQLFKAGRLKIRCIASIHDVYWQSTEKSVEEDRPRSIQLEAVGPKLIPHFNDFSTSEPRFFHELNDRPPPAAGARRYMTLDQQTLIAMLLLLLLRMT